MRIIEKIEYVVSVIVFICFVGILLALAVDVIVGPNQLTTATMAVRSPTEAEKAMYMSELRKLDDEQSRHSVRVMEAKAAAGQ